MHPNPRSAFHCRRRPGALAVTGILLALTLAGCSGDTEDASLKKAQATVTAKEKDLTDAETAATAAETGSARRARPTSRLWTATATSSTPRP